MWERGRRTRGLNLGKIQKSLCESHVGTDFLKGVKLSTQWGRDRSRQVRGKPWRTVQLRLISSNLSQSPPQ